MCNHEWIKLKDVKACVKCGLTCTYDNKLFFDKKLVKIANRKEKQK